MKRVILSLAVMLLVTAGAQAGTAVCTVSTSGVAFGSFNPLAGQSADTAGTISVTCTGTAGDSASYTITINSGLGSFGTRKMVSGADSLTYNLYKDSGCTQVWGDGTGSTSAVTGSITLTSSSATNNHLVYSRVASGQNTAKAHTYSDNLVVTITY
jgi:spore coat protein U-like protein